LCTNLRRYLGVAVALAVGLFVIPAATSATPRSFDLTFDGRMGKRVDIAKWIHEGTFVSSSPFCASGSGTDTSVVSGSRPARTVRVFTCDDGSGSITARAVNYDAEETPYTTGTWQIVDGTGAYQSFRGKGEITGGPLSGNPQQPQTLIFRARWLGIADFDDVAPTLDFARAGTTKLGRPKGAYDVRIAFSIRDNVDENTVTYTASAYWPGATHFVTRGGQIQSGDVELTLRVRPRTSVHRVRVQILATDPLGNERQVTRFVRL
jgi:hypothetical protein